jgi:mono/diheme cytochrome c family protein
VYHISTSGTFGSRTLRTLVARFALVTLLLPVSATLVMGQDGSPAAQVTGSVANGRGLYYDHTCYGCHGFNGETGSRDLVGTNSAVLASEENFVRFLRLRADQAPLFPSTRMPNYPESSLSDAQARDIYAFIRSFRMSAPDVEDVPALQTIIESASRPYEP